MSVQPEPVSNKDSAGPGLGGLPAVNQSPSATAQTQHSPHDPYPNAYPVYHEGVPFSNSYNSNISLNSAYYPHPHSPVDVSQQGQRDQHAQGQHAFHSEQQSRQVQAGTQRQAPMHALSQPEGPAQSHVPPSNQHAQQAQPSPIGPPPLHDTSLDLSTSQSTTASSPPAAKRQQDVAAPPEDEGPPAKRQKHRTSMSQMSLEGDGEVKDEGEVGPGGGAKHWTDEEKSKLFHWTLDDDDRWKAFGDKMNTVFREGSTQVFNGRKTFTALKSCYHRNVEVFKQIYAFEGFLARAPFMPSQASHDISSAPSSSTSSLSFPQDANEMAKMPTPTTFVAAAQRHAFLERKLEAARALNVPVGNLTVKVIDHWCEMGWYLLFKKRFKEDPSTGLPVPRYPSTDVIDDADVDAEGEDAATSDQDSHNAEARPSEARRRHLNPMDSIIPPPLPNQGPVTPSVSRVHRASSPRHSIVNQTPGPSHHPIVGPSSPQVPYGYPPPPPISYYGSQPVPPDYYVQQHHFQQQQLHFQAQTAQTLSHLTNLTQTLLGTCSTLVDLVRAQMEDGRVLLEIVRRREEREENNSRPASRENGTSSGSGGGDMLSKNNKATLATEVLSNPNVSDEVRQAATDYLKKMFQ